MVSRTFALCAVVSVWLLPVSAIGNDLVPILHDSRHTVFLDSARGRPPDCPFLFSNRLPERKIARSPVAVEISDSRQEPRYSFAARPTGPGAENEPNGRSALVRRPEGKKIRVKVTGQLKAKSLGMSFWKIDVENATPFSLWSLDFPGVRIQGDPQGRDILAIPLGNGLAVQDPSRNKGLVAMRAYFGTNIGGAAYPCGLQTMQFATYYRDGRRPVGGDVRFGPERQVVCLRAGPGPRMPGVVVSPQLPYMGVVGHSYHQSYEAVLGVYQGDWYDACQIYRAWAVNQVWCAKGRCTREPTCRSGLGRPPSA